MMRTGLGRHIGVGLEKKPSTSAFGPKRSFVVLKSMSAHPEKADMQRTRTKHRLRRFSPMKATASSVIFVVVASCGPACAVPLSARPASPGYCIGGTLLESALAYLATREEECFSSATFLTTQFDFSKAGDLAIFTSDTHRAVLEGFRARLPRRLAGRKRIQHDAAKGSHLARQETASIRHPLLEPRLDTDASCKPLVLFARILR
jgi:hypothetical protein